jgi:hypothetical protein
MVSILGVKQKKKFSSPIGHSGAHCCKLRTTFGFSRTDNCNKIYMEVAGNSYRTDAVGPAVDQHHGSSPVASGFHYYKFIMESNHSPFSHVTYLFQDIMNFIWRLF